MKTPYEKFTSNFLGPKFKKFKQKKAKEFTKQVIMAHEDPEGYVDQLITYKHIMMGRTPFNVREYMNAVRFATHRFAGDSIIDAYKKTFPERLTRPDPNNPNKLVDKPYGTIESLCSIYHRGKLPQAILAQAQIPIHIVMMSERIQAANVLANLMINGDTERIQMESADKLLQHIKPPETLEVDVSITHTADDTLNDIEASLTQLANFAQAKIQNNLITPTEVIEASVYKDD